MGILKLDKNLNAFDNSGQTEEYKYGQGLTGQGIAGLQGLGGQYQDLINQGGLSQNLMRQFAIARGGLQDNATRQQRAFGAQLAQKYSQSGGQLSPSAMTEFGLENQQSNNESLFGATNTLNMNQAQMGLENTNALFGRLQDVSKSIAGIGQSEEDRARQMQVEGIKARLENKRTVYNFMKFW